MHYFTVATAGHVDHGKTSLLKALTGIDPDRLKEEKERQMTTDLGFAHLVVDDLTIGFIDVPGHGKFLKNMLAGVGGIDAALLVVAADEGPMPQTVQHVRILSCLRVPGIVVAINKVDAVTQERIDSTLSRTKLLLSEFGLDIVGITCVSASRGTGLAELRDALLSACTSLRKAKELEEACDARLFLPIDRSFSKAGFGTVVTGTVVQGTITTGDQVFIEPDGVSAKVRRLESFGTVRQNAIAGQRVAVNLAMKENKSLVRGSVIMAQKATPAKTIIVSLFGSPQETIADIATRKDLCNDVRIYHGTAELPGHIRLVEQKSSVNAFAKIALDQLIIAEPGNYIIVRLDDETILGGKILLLDPPRWIVRGKLPQICQPLTEGYLSSAVLTYLELCPNGVSRLSDLNRLLPSGKVKEVVRQLLADGLVFEAGEFIMKNAQQQQLTEMLLEAVEIGAIDSGGGNSGISMETLRAKVMPVLNRDIFQKLTRDLIALGKIEAKGDKLISAGKTQVDAAFEQREILRQEIVQILSSCLCLEIDQIAKQCKTSAGQVRVALADLTLQNKASVVGYEFAALTVSLDKCHQTLSELWQKHANISPSEFREALGISRKYVMALLSYFDDHLITRRVSDGRALLRPQIRH